MPLMDVTDVIMDIDFLDELQLIRSVQTISQGGMAVNTSKTTTIYGVVTSESGTSLKRESQGEHIEQTILVITPTRLIDGRAINGVAYTADIIVWDGSQYTVKNVDPYQRYGRGFVQAKCDLVPLTGDGP